MKMFASVCAVLFVLALGNVAEAGCWKWRCCGPRIILRPVCVPVCAPVEVKPVPVELVPVEYPTPLRNLLFGTHRVQPCADGSCNKPEAEAK